MSGQFGYLRNPGIKLGADAMASRSRNTPYEGREVRGKVRHTILAGEPVVIAGEAQR